MDTLEEQSEKNSQEQGAEIDVKKPKRASVKLNAIFNFISQFLTILLPVLSTPYLSRVLHENGTGQVSYAVSIVSIFLTLSNIGLDAYGQREIAKAKDDIQAKSQVFWELVLLRTITSTIGIGVFLLIFFTIGFFKADNIVLIYAIALIGNIFDINFFFRGEEDFKTVAIRNIGLKLIALIGIFIFVKTENDAWIYALILGASILLSSLFMWPALRKRVVKPHPKEFHLRRHIAPAFRIFLPALAVTLYSLLDKIEIGIFAENSDYENGCYEQAYKINYSSLFIVTMVSTVLAPRSAYEYKNGDLKSFDHHVNVSFQFVFLIALPLIAGFLFLSGNLCAWFLGPGYEKAPTVLRILSAKYLLSGFGFILSDQIFVPIGKERYAAISSGIALLVNVSINIPFIMFFGAIGAAIATVISEFINMVVLSIFAIKQGLIHPKGILSPVWKYVLGAILMSCLVFGMTFIPGSDHSVWVFLAIVAAASIFYFGILLLLKDSITINLLKAFIRKFKRKKGVQNDD